MFPGDNDTLRAASAMIGHPGLEINLDQPCPVQFGGAMPYEPSWSTTKRRHAVR